MPLKHPFTPLSVAESFVREVMKLHGFPSMIVSGQNLYEPFLEGVISLTRNKFTP